MDQGAHAQQSVLQPFRERCGDVKLGYINVYVLVAIARKRRVLRLDLHAHDAKFTGGHVRGSHSDSSTYANRSTIRGTQFL